MTSIRKSAATAPRRTSSTFTSGAQQGHLTRERIAKDMAAFDKAGGKIEVLGNTPLRGKDGVLKPATAAPVATGQTGKN
ncbi:conserved hypothetical protein [uncultured Stenotrophomonas sp.]|uniref:Uncharacterized protein n=1 Tax=uncultured Stenotrophomonas sp. TaxID=165438 RepID=A0A1Y5Q152_9GAMM|nr:conserved hypothetical protein [uncultured Stenotrophomonas sp.]